MVHFFFLILGLFVAGSSIGSFAGVMTDRRMNVSIWTGRSQCLSCKTQLAWYELIPIISYLRQKGRCVHCGENIPSWVLHIELMHGIIWTLFGMIFILQGWPLILTFIHLLLLSGLLALAFEDMRYYTIPDNISLPLIIGSLLYIIILSGSRGMMPEIYDTLVGGLTGMYFYLAQMIVPALWSAFQKRHYHDALHMIFLPLFFPFWLGVKAIFGEKCADQWISSIRIIDTYETWVGGGDVRLGLLVGILMGPTYFWWTIGIGYTLGTLIWGINRIFRGKKIDILPVAPLIFLGFCLAWIIRIYS